MPDSSPTQSTQPADVTNATVEQCPIFQEMTDEQRRPVLELMQHETYPQGETILREGRSIQILWIIVRGECEVLKSTQNGGQHQLAVLGPCAVFGEMSFFHQAVHSASIRTLSEVEVMRLSRENYDRLLETAPSIAHKIAANTIGILAERLRLMDDWVCRLVERPDGVQHQKEWREFRSKLYSAWEF